MRGLADGLPVFAQGLGQVFRRHPLDGEHHWPGKPGFSFDVAQSLQFAACAGYEGVQPVAVLDPREAGRQRREAQPVGEKDAITFAGTEGQGMFGSAVRRCAEHLDLVGGDGKAAGRLRRGQGIAIVDILHERIFTHVFFVENL